MARLPKCPECEKEVEKVEGEFVKHSGKTYHIKCFEKFNIRKQHRSELIEYICQLKKIKMPTGFILKQIKEMEDDYGYTLKGIEMTLRYVHDTEKLASIDEAGIGIVQYYYTRAKEYNINLYKITQANAKINYDNTEITIYSTPPKQKEKKTIDIMGI